MEKMNIVNITVKRIGNIIGALIPLIWFLLDNDWYIAGYRTGYREPTAGYDGAFALIILSIISWFVVGWFANYLAHTKFVITVEPSKKVLEKKEKSIAIKVNNLTSTENSKAEPVELIKADTIIQEKRNESVQDKATVNDSQSSDDLKNNSKDNALTWNGLFIRIVIAFVFYVIAAYFLMPLPWVDSLNEMQNNIRKGSTLVIFFIVPLVFTSLIAIFIVKVIPSTRSEPLPPFLNVALMTAIVIYAMILFGSWNANRILSM